MRVCVCVSMRVWMGGYAYVGGWLGVCVRVAPFVNNKPFGLTLGYMFSPVVGCGSFPRCLIEPGRVKLVME